MNSYLKHLDSHMDNRSYAPGYSYKYAPGQYALDSVDADRFKIDEARMAVYIPFASGLRRDGVGDLLEVSGIETDRHRLNPIVLFDHGKQVTLPIAVSEDPKTKSYTVELDPSTRTGGAWAFFYGSKGVDSYSNYDHALFCEQVFDMMAKRFIRGGSIGYTIIEARELPPDYRTGIPAGLHLIRTKMLELSAVILPANADTVSKSLRYWHEARMDLAREVLSMPKICGRPPSPYLVKSLQDFVHTKANYGEQKAVHRIGVVGKDPKLLNQGDFLDKVDDQLYGPRGTIEPQQPDQTYRGDQPVVNFYGRAAAAHTAGNPYEVTHNSDLGQGSTREGFDTKEEAEQRARQVGDVLKGAGEQVVDEEYRVQDKSIEPVRQRKSINIPRLAPKAKAIDVNSKAIGRPRPGENVTASESRQGDGTFKGRVVQNHPNPKVAGSTVQADTGEYVTWSDSDLRDETGAQYGDGNSKAIGRPQTGDRVTYTARNFANTPVTVTGNVATDVPDDDFTEVDSDDAIVYGLERYPDTHRLRDETGAPYEVDVEPKGLRRPEVGERVHNVYYGDAGEVVDVGAEPPFEEEISWDADDGEGYLTNSRDLRSETGEAYGTGEASDLINEGGHPHPPERDVPEGQEQADFNRHMAQARNPGNQKAIGRPQQKSRNDPRDVFNFTEDMLAASGNLRRGENGEGDIYYGDAPEVMDADAENNQKFREDREKLDQQIFGNTVTPQDLAAQRQQQSGQKSEPKSPPPYRTTNDGDRVHFDYYDNGEVAGGGTGEASGLVHVIGLDNYTGVYETDETGRRTGGRFVLPHDKLKDDSGQSYGEQRKAIHQESGIDPENPNTYRTPEPGSLVYRGSASRPVVAMSTDRDPETGEGTTHTDDPMYPSVQTRRFQDEHGIPFKSFKDLRNKYRKKSLIKRKSANTKDPLGPGRVYKNPLSNSNVPPPKWRAGAGAVKSADEGEAPKQPVEIEYVNRRSLPKDDRGRAYDKVDLELMARRPAGTSKVTDTQYPAQVPQPPRFRGYDTAAINVRDPETGERRSYAAETHSDAEHFAGKERAYYEDQGRKVEHSTRNQTKRFKSLRNKYRVKRSEFDKRVEDVQKNRDEVDKDVTRMREHEGIEDEPYDYSLTPHQTVTLYYPNASREEHSQKRMKSAEQLKQNADEAKIRPVTDEEHTVPEPHVAKYHVRDRRNLASRGGLNKLEADMQTSGVPGDYENLSQAEAAIDISGHTIPFKTVDQAKRAAQEHAQRAYERGVPTEVTYGAEKQIKARKSADQNDDVDPELQGDNESWADYVARKTGRPKPADGPPKGTVNPHSGIDVNDPNTYRSPTEGQTVRVRGTGEEFVADFTDRNAHIQNGRGYTWRQGSSTPRGMPTASLDDTEGIPFKSLRTKYRKKAGNVNQYGEIETSTPRGSSGTSKKPKNTAGKEVLLTTASPRGKLTLTRKKSEYDPNPQPTDNTPAGYAQEDLSNNYEQKANYADTDYNKPYLPPDGTVDKSAVYQHPVGGVVNNYVLEDPEADPDSEIDQLNEQERGPRFVRKSVKGVDNPKYIDDPKNDKPPQNSVRNDIDPEVANRLNAVRGRPKVGDRVKTPYQESEISADLGHPDGLYRMDDNLLFYSDELTDPEGVPYKSLNNAVSMQEKQLNALAKFVSRLVGGIKSVEQLKQTADAAKVKPTDSSEEDDDDTPEMPLESHSSHLPLEQRPLDDVIRTGHEYLNNGLKERQIREQRERLLSQQEKQLNTITKFINAVIGVKAQHPTPPEDVTDPTAPVETDDRTEQQRQWDDNARLWNISAGQDVVDTIGRFFPRP